MIWDSHNDEYLSQEWICCCIYLKLFLKLIKVMNL